MGIDQIFSSGGSAAARRYFAHFLITKEHSIATRYSTATSRDLTGSTPMY